MKVRVMIMAMIAVLAVTMNDTNMWVNCWLITQFRLNCILLINTVLALKLYLVKNKSFWKKMFVINTKTQIHFQCNLQLQEVFLKCWMLLSLHIFFTNT
jgi:hypothetical protein